MIWGQVQGHPVWISHGWAPWLRRARKSSALGWQRREENERNYKELLWASPWEPRGWLRDTSLKLNPPQGLLFFKCRTPLNGATWVPVLWAEYLIRSLLCAHLPSWHWNWSEGVRTQNYELLEGEGTLEMIQSNLPLNSGTFHCPLAYLLLGGVQ